MPPHLVTIDTKGPAGYVLAGPSDKGGIMYIYLNTQTLTGRATHHVKAGKKITLVYRDPAAGRIEAPGFVRLDPEACLYHAHRLQTAGHDRLCHYVQMVTGQPLDWYGTAWRGSNRGAYDQAHLFGRLDLTLKLFEISKAARKNLRLFWVLPESGLHPRWQLGLADAAIKIREEFDNATEE